MINLHRVNLVISPRPPGPPLDLAVGFVLVDRRDGRPPAVLESWDDAVLYCGRLARGPGGRVVYATTWLAGPKVGQLVQTTRWRVELEHSPRREWWTPAARKEAKPRPWQSKIEGGGGDEDDDQSQ